MKYECNLHILQKMKYLLNMQIFAGHYNCIWAGLSTTFLKYTLGALIPTLSLKKNLLQYASNWSKVIVLTDWYNTVRYQLEYYFSL